MAIHTHSSVFGPLTRVQGQWIDDAPAPPVAPPIINPPTAEAIATCIMRGEAPHAIADASADDGRPCGCVLCALPRGAGWSESELTSRVAWMGQQAHLAIMAVAAFALRGRRPGDRSRAWAFEFMVGSSGKAGRGIWKSYSWAAGGVIALLLLVGCGGIAIAPVGDEQPQQADAAPAVVAPDAAPAPACRDGIPACEPLSLRECSAGGGAYQRCYSDGCGWGPCL